MEVTGFAELTKDAEIFGALTPKDFQGNICIVMEFDTDGGALVLNPEGNALGMVNRKSVKRSFRCKLVNDLYVLPPNLDSLGKMQYLEMCMNRKGGYTELLKRMVISRSLMCGEFNDKFIWGNQK